MLKGVKEVFCITLDGKYRTFGFMRALKGVRFSEIFIPKVILDKVTEEGAASARARDWYKNILLPLVVRGGKIHKEGDVELKIDTDQCRVEDSDTVGSKKKKK